MAALAIHPSVDKGVQASSPEIKELTLTCKCSDSPVAVSIKGNVAFNHVCGCTKCWKPSGALFSLVAVVPRENLSVTANSQKLKVVDTSAAIQRHACKVRRAHVRPHREQSASLLWIRLRTSRACEGVRLGGARVCSVRFFDHRGGY